MTMHTFHVGDRAIRYRRTGRGTPVVLTPGGRLGSAVLAWLVSVIEDHVEFNQWDRSNTGPSDLYLDKSTGTEPVRRRCGTAG